ncbi:response regulator [Cohnella lupini]|nr:response regulator [Cohnella lupini]
MKWKTCSILIAFVIVYSLRFYWQYGLDRELPQAKAGVLDLSGWDAQSGKVVSLRGDWLFVPGKFIAPEAGQLLGNIEGERELKVPGAWDRELGEERSTTYGFGTYRLRILLPDNTAGKYGIRAQVIRTAHKLYVNGELLGQKGEPGADAASSRPRVSPYIVSFSTDMKEAEIVIQASNFHYGRLGGIFDDIQFGSAESINRYGEIQLVGNNLLMGFYAMSGLFFIILYLFRRISRELLYFSSFFWMSLLFWSTHEERLLFWLLPGIDYEWQTKLQSLPSLGLFLFLFLFVRALFPRIGNRKLDKFAVGLTLATACLVLFTQVDFYSRFELVMISVDGVLLFYSFYILIRGSFKSNNDFVFSAIAAICILMESFMQGIFYMGFVPDRGFPPIERIGFIVSMAMLIAKRFFTNMEQVEIMSKRLLLADRLKNDFLVNTSNEIRVPLHGLINLAQIMIDEGGLKETRQEERLSLMVSTGRRLVHLLNDILDLSKINDSGVELSLRPVDVRMTINGVLEVMRYMTDKAAVNFVNLTEPGIPYVQADEQRLMQILFNLLHYTVKSGAEGIIPVKAEFKGGPKEVVVTIDALFQGNVPNNELPEAELNLNISRKLIELHGGTFAEHTSRHSGMELRFTLPLSDNQEVVLSELTRGNPEAEEELYSMVAATAAPSDLPIDAPKVLIVDDDPVNLKIMEELLALEGLKVTAVMDGIEGLKAWERGTDWDLVVLDVMLPGMSGYDLCRQIRSRNSFYDLPVLFLTSRIQPADLLVGFDAGANDYVTQPIDASEFRARTRTLLRMKQSIRDQLHMEMALIQAQIKPHFLYNTLNTIASLSEIDPEKTRELLNDFGSYLRSSFDMRNLDKKVPFSKEWTLVESYLQIEQARFGNRMKVTTALPDNLQFGIPPLSIQPIVENALRHGILPRFEGGNLLIAVSEEVGGYRIIVRDDGVGFASDKIEAVLSGTYRSGIGLLNVHRRLLNTFGEGLIIESKEGLGTEVSFRIPAAKEETEL